MTLQALYFGSIGTLVESSHLQRRAFNEAFRAAGASVRWTAEEYRELVAVPGGLARIERALAGTAIDPAAVHREKDRLFVDAIESDPDLRLRPGVERLVGEARDAGLVLGLVTTTSRDTVQALAERFRDRLGLSSWRALLDSRHAARPKPAPDIWQACQESTGIPADRALAIEDSPANAAAAKAAGLRCLAVPGAVHAGRAFPDGVPVVDSLETGPVTIASLQPSAATAWPEAAPGGCAAALPARP